MTTFKQYLRSRWLAPSSVKGHGENLVRFKKWCQQEQLTDPGRLNYRELLGWVSNQKERGVSRATINNHLNTVTKYYDYLISEGYREDNPAKRLRVKKATQTVTADLLKPEQLDRLYEQYKNQQPESEKQQLLHARNTVILGLLIYQAAGATELRKLETTHVDFDKGTVYLPGSRRSASRTLKLHPSQIIPLHSYVLQTLPQLAPEGDILIPGKIHAVLYWLFRQLHKMDQQVRNTQQIRASVIVQWVRQYNIRQVQYMAGHKHISSTERYRQQDLESLQDALLKYHPIG